MGSGAAFARVVLDVSQFRQASADVRSAMADIHSSVLSASTGTKQSFSEVGSSISTSFSSIASTVRSVTANMLALTSAATAAGGAGAAVLATMTGAAVALAAAIGAAVAAFAALVAISAAGVGAAYNWATEVQTIVNTTGMAAESASALAIANQQTGHSAREVAISLNFLSENRRKAMAAEEEAAKKAAINTAALGDRLGELNGDHLYNIGKIAQDLADRLAEIIRQAGEANDVYQEQRTNAETDHNDRIKEARANLIEALSDLEKRHAQAVADTQRQMADAAEEFEYQKAQILERFQQQNEDTQSARQDRLAEMAQAHQDKIDNYEASAQDLKDALADTEVTRAERLQQTLVNITEKYSRQRASLTEQYMNSDPLLRPFLRQQLGALDAMEAAEKQAAVDKDNAELTALRNKEARQLAEIQRRIDQENVMYALKLARQEELDKKNDARQAQSLANELERLQHSYDRQTESFTRRLNEEMVAYADQQTRMRREEDQKESRENATYEKSVARAESAHARELASFVRMQGAAERAADDRITAEERRYAKALDTLADQLAKIVSAAANLPNTSDPFIRGLKSLGLTLADIKDLNAEELFSLLTKKFNELPESIDKASIAFDIFGFFGQQMIQLMRIMGSDGIEGLKKKFKELLPDMILTNEELASMIASQQDWKLMEMVFQDLLVTLGKELLPSVKELVLWFRDWWKEHGPAVVQVVKNLGRAIGLVVDTLTGKESGQSLPVLLKAWIVGGVESAFSDLITAIKKLLVGDLTDAVFKLLSDFFRGYWDEISYDLDQVFKAMSAPFKKLHDDITGDLTAVNNSIINILSATLTDLKGRVEIAWNDIKAFWTTGVNDLVQSPNKAAAQFNAALDTSLHDLVTAVRSDLSEIWEAMTKPFIDAWTYLQSLWQTFKNLGGDIMAGLIAGLTEKWNELKRSFITPIEDALRDLKNILGIHSESTVMRDIGRNLREGLNSGWQPDVVKASIENALNINVGQRPINAASITRSISIGQVILQLPNGKAPDPGAFAQEFVDQLYRRGVAVGTI